MAFLQSRTTPYCEDESSRGVVLSAADIGNDIRQRSTQAHKCIHRSLVARRKATT